MEKTHKILMRNNNNSFPSNFAGSVNSWKSFTTKAEKFIQKTQENVLQGLILVEFTKQYGVEMHLISLRIGFYLAIFKE